MTVTSNDGIVKDKAFLNGNKLYLKNSVQNHSLTVSGAIQPVDLNPVLFPATHDPVIARRQSHVATVKARLKPIAVCDSVIINTAKGLSPERDVNVGAYSIDATGVVTFTPLVNFVGTAPAATV